jgi:hypothetical protein
MGKPRLSDETIDVMDDLDIQSDPFSYGNLRRESEEFSDLFDQPIEEEEGDEE